MADALPPLTADEIEHFVTHGFVVKRQVLDPQLCAAARDRLWAGNTSSHLRRDDPRTWVGGLPETDRVSTTDGLNDRTAKHGWRLRELAGDELMIELLPRRVFPWLEQLLGKGQVVQPEVTSSPEDPDPRGTRLRGWPVWGGKELRGVYCVLPEEKTATSPSMADAARAGAHIDPEPVQLIASGYIDRVPKGGGGIALFPGSHRLLAEAVPEAADQGSYSILHPPHPQTGAAEFKLPLPADLKDKLADIEPFEFHGEEGDVILWHGNTYHAATPNYATDPPQIRQLVLYDAYRTSVYERVFTGRYTRGPCASPPPRVRKLHGLELGPPLPPPPPRAEGTGFWADWSQDVQQTAHALGL